jgi:hypothetical protein
LPHNVPSVHAFRRHRYGNQITVCINLGFVTEGIIPRHALSVRRESRETASL